MSLTDLRRCRTSSGSNREIAPPTVVSYPGHTHAIATNGLSAPFSPLYLTAKPVPADSPYPNNFALGYFTRMASRCTSRSSLFPRRLNFGVRKGTSR